MAIEINEVFNEVQGSDELKSEFISKFAESDFGKDFLGKYKANNTPKYFELDESGKIIPESVDDKIGQLIGHERAKVHSAWDEKISALTGIERPEGETKGWAEKALQNYIDQKTQEAIKEPDKRIKELKEAHISELQKIKDDNMRAQGEWEQKYNSLSDTYVNTQKDGAWSKALSGLDINIGKLDEVQKVFVQSKIEEGKRISSLENDKLVLKDKDGTILRKPNQEDVTPEDFLRKALEPIMNGSGKRNGGGASALDSQGNVNNSAIIGHAKTRSEALNELKEIMQKKGFSPDDKEFRSEFSKLKDSKEYKALSY